MDSFEFAAKQSVALILIGNIGDLLLLEPVIRFLHQRGLTIDLFCTAETAMVWSDDPRVHRVISVRSSNQKYSATEGASEWAKARYDFLLDFWPTGRSVKLAVRSRARTKVTWSGLGAKKVLRALVYSDRVTFPGLDIKRADVYLRLLKLDPSTRAALLPARLKIPPENLNRFRQKHAIGEENFLVLQPTARWQRKVWPADRWRNLIQRIQKESHLKLRLVAGPVEEERRFLAEVAEGLVGPEDLFSGNLVWNELTCLIGAATGFIGLDSAPYHAAAMLGKPLVVLFGPTNEKEWGPALPHQTVVTPPAGTERLIGKIEVDQVWAACRETFAF